MGSLNGTHFLGIKFDAKVYGSFEGSLWKIVHWFGLVSYKTPVYPPGKSDIPYQRIFWRWFSFSPAKDMFNMLVSWRVTQLGVSSIFFWRKLVKWSRLWFVLCSFKHESAVLNSQDPTDGLEYEIHPRELAARVLYFPFGAWSLFKGRDVELHQFKKWFWFGHTHRRFPPSLTLALVWDFSRLENAWILGTFWERGMGCNSKKARWEEGISEPH